MKDWCMNKEDMIIGNEVVCTFNSDGGIKEKLTLDKKYTIVSIEPVLKWIEVVSDDGKLQFYDIIRFITLQQWRHNQLNTLLE